MIKLSKANLKQILFSNIDVILFIIIIEIKLLFSMHKILTKDFSFSLIIIPTLSSVLIFTSFALLFKNNTKTRLLLLFDFIISGFLIADIIYFGYFKDILSVADITNGIRLGGDSASTYSVLKSVLKLKDFLLLLDCIFFIILYNKFYKKIDKKQAKFISRFIYFTLVFFIGISINAMCIYKFNKDKPGLMATMSNKVFIVRNLGTTDYHLLDIYNSIKTDIDSKHSISNKRNTQIQNFLQNNNKSCSSLNFTGTGKGKNLIVIQVEALQQFVINSKVNGNEVTPNLNKWINKSLYFDNFFYQVAEGNTADAEFMLNNSLYPAATGAAYFKYDNNSFTSLPNALKKQGYYTAAFHGNYKSFWNRDKMYDSMGFNIFYSENKLDMNEKIGMGLSDKSFFQQSIKKIKTFKQPYFSFLITLSSHYPFNRDTRKYGSFDTGKYRGTLMGDYLKAIHYTDTQIGWFLDELEKEGILNNSILILYGDHNALPKDYSDKLFDLTNTHIKNDLKWYELQKVPMLIHFPRNENSGINHTYCGEIDLYPTITNMFSIPKKNMMGKDIFNSNNPMVIFRNGSFTNGNIFYISWNDKFYNMNTGKHISSSSNLKKLENEANNELGYSDDILNHNLLNEK